jgi:FixJ family two-component response regulator
MNYTTHCLSQSSYPAHETPTVFIVDNDVTVRESLDQKIRASGWRTSTASSAEEFLSRPRVMAPGCLLMELRLPGLSGLHLQRLVLDRTEMPVIFMSGAADIPTTVTAMRAGAIEFLTKPLRSDAVMQAISEALEQSQAVLRDMARTMPLRTRYQSLSCRERQVMKLVVAGRLNKQVADELGISEVTVKAHRGRVMRKMHANSFAELVGMSASYHASSRAQGVAADEIEVIPTLARKVPAQCAGPQRAMLARPQIQQRPQQQGTL